TDLNLLVTDLKGNIIKDAVVKIDEKHLPFMSRIGTYFKKKYRKSGLLTITVEDKTYFFNLKNDKRNKITIRRIGAKMLYSFPLRYITLPIRNFVTTIFRSIKWGEPQGFVKKIWGIFDEYYRDDYDDDKNKYKGYVVFSKPKYQPADSIKCKVWLHNKKHKPLEKQLEVFLAKNYRETYKLAEVSPIRPGVYHYTFLPPDSLNLQVNKSYEVIWKYKGREVISDYFKLENYILDEVDLEVNAESTHFKKEQQAIDIKATNSNRLPVKDGALSIALIPKKFYAFDTTEYFVPDTLWQVKEVAGNKGEVKISPPDSLFDVFSMEYNVHVNFTNTAGEIHNEYWKSTFYHHQNPLGIQLEDDSIQVVTDEENIQSVWLYTFFEDMIDSVKLNVPEKVRINPKALEYKVFTKDYNEQLSLSEEPDKVQCFAYHTGDSVFIQLSNPRQLDLWYSIYKKNKVKVRGKEKSLSFSAKANKKVNWFVSYQYMWAGEMHQKNYAVYYRDEALDVSLEHPKKAYPGKEIAFKVRVKDQQGQPVTGSELTALGYTAKFREDNLPNTKTWANSAYYRKSKNDYQLQHFQYKEMNRLFDFDTYKHTFALAQNKYYQFLNPENGYSTVYLPIEDSIPQFTPFVSENGKPKAVHLIYLDDELIYFRNTDLIKKYAFRASKGKNRISIRTANELITIDSVNLLPYKKLLFNLDVDNLPKGTTCIPLENMLTKEEENLLLSSLIYIKNNFKGNELYLQQGKHFRVLGKDNSTYHRNNKAYLKAGPFRKDSLQVFLPEKFSLSTYFEGGYDYTFNKGLIKMKDQLSQVIRSEYFLQPVYDSEVKLSDEAFTILPIPEKSKDPIITVQNEMWELTEATQMGKFLYNWQSGYKIKKVILQ
ncbi:MAG: hypothetical protein AAGI07_18795, partial [Bacteroidota bacterium]